MLLYTVPENRLSRPLILPHSTYNLLFAVLGAGDEVDGFHMSKVNVPAENIHVQQLAHILFLVVPAQVAL